LKNLITPANTTVFILAAGRGQRMMPLTEKQPKPLLKVGTRSLIEHHINRLAELGFKNIVINIAYLGEHIVNALGNGSRWGVDIHYSDETAMGALETAGGIHNALDLIKSSHFLCLNADIWTNFNFASLLTHFNTKQDNSATIVLVENPEHNLAGDFCLHPHSQTVSRKSRFDSLSPDYKSYTFSGIGLYNKQDFTHLNAGKHPLAPLLKSWCDKNVLSGIIHSGQWHDIGTPARLDDINQSLDHESGL